MSVITNILELQHKAWNAGHQNYGASIDVEAEAVSVLEGFKHLNPRQKEYLDILKAKDELKYAYPLCSSARKAVRHFVVTLK
ncbi:rIII lysis inhibition accessory protein, rapid lysis phenotype [Citrobacter phage CkP1]|nr:rIII lysis inhibition accessory protein, rapid lysis phenotype [Citrobacter phage CkP1]